MITLTRYQSAGCIMLTYFLIVTLHSLLYFQGVTADPSSSSSSSPSSSSSSSVNNASAVYNGIYTSSGRSRDSSRKSHSRNHNFLLNGNHSNNYNRSSGSSSSSSLSPSSSSKSANPFASSNHKIASSSSSSSSPSSSTSLSSSTPPYVRFDCDKALALCTKRMNCGISLHDYRISCKPEIYGSNINCSDSCRMSMISLASTTEGYDYLNCDCAQNEYCKLVRKRIEPCNPKKSPKQENESCRAAELYCRADNVCNTAFDYYRRNCHDLIKGLTRSCSRKCHDKINLLWRQRSGQQLKTCRCEGSKSCRKEREGIMRQCFGMDGYKADSGSGNALLSHSFHALQMCSIITLIHFVRFY